jgi:hypothetical protein
MKQNKREKKEEGKKVGEKNEKRFNGKKECDREVIERCLRCF